MNCKGRRKKLSVLELHKNNKEGWKLNMLLNRKQLLNTLQTISKRTEMKLEVRELTSIEISIECLIVG